MTLKSLCSEKGFTLTRLAEKSKVSIVYLSNLNTGLKKNPSLEVLNRIASTLGVTIDKLKDSLIN